MLKLWLTHLRLRAQRTLLNWLGLLLLLLLLLTSLWGKCSVFSLRLFLLLNCLFGVVDSWLIASFEEILLTGLWLYWFSPSSLLPSRTQSLIQAVTTLSERNHVRILRVPVPWERYCVYLGLVGRFEGFLWLARGQKLGKLLGATLHKPVFCTIKKSIEAFIELHALMIEVFHRLDKQLLDLPHLLALLTWVKRLQLLLKSKCET